LIGGIKPNQSEPWIVEVENGVQRNGYDRGVENHMKQTTALAFLHGVASEEGAQESYRYKQEENQ
jgi:hypothetical protein